MAKESSFDVVSTVDMQESRQRVPARRRRNSTQRYDLKDSGAEIALDKAKAGRSPCRPPSSDFVARAGHRRHRQRSSSSAASIWPPSSGATAQPAAGQSVRQSAQRSSTASHRDTASAASTRTSRQAKLKVKVQIEGDKLRVSSASRDALQEVIAFLKGQDYGQPLQYVNYR